MMRSFIFALLLCATAQAQFMPVGFWKTTATAAFSPDQVDSLVYWLDASTITGKTSGDTIGIWTPRVGKNMVQLTAAKKPTYYADSLGGKPSVYGDGSDDHMKASLAVYSSDITVFVVRKLRKRTADGRNPRIIGLQRVDNEDWTAGSLAVADTVDGSTKSYVYSNGVVCGTTSRAANIPEIITVELTGSSGVMTRDTANVRYVSAFSTTINTTDAILFSLNQGASEAAYIHIAEVLIYTRYLTSAEKTNIWVYLKNKYSI